uniref:FLYWCH-type domain-containing protein n=1 Tax=Strongyloides papillosus TaxID=174720 RepID=A0A0N5BPB4_STREA
NALWKVAKKSNLNEVEDSEFQEYFKNLYINTYKHWYGPLVKTNNHLESYNRSIKCIFYRRLKNLEGYFGGVVELIIYANSKILESDDDEFNKITRKIYKEAFELKTLNVPLIRSDPYRCVAIGSSITNEELKNMLNVCRSKSWSTIQDFQKLISIGYLNNGTMCTCMVNGIQCAHIKYTF